MLPTLCSDPEEPPEEVVGDLQLCVDVGQVTNSTQHLTHHPSHNSRESRHDR